MKRKIFWGIGIVGAGFVIVLSIILFPSPPMGTRVEDTDDYLMAYDERSGPSWSDPSKKKLDRYLEILNEIGLLGEHPLERLTSVDGVSGKINGRFFLLAGSVSGNLQSSPVFKFAWRVGNYRFISTFPTEKTRVVIDEREIATIRFKFNVNALYNYASWEEVRHGKENPNVFISPRYIIFATVRMSKKAWEEIIFLSPEK